MPRHREAAHQAQLPLLPRVPLAQGGHHAARRGIERRGGSRTADRQRQVDVGRREDLERTAQRQGVAREIQGRHAQGRGAEVHLQNRGTHPLTPPGLVIRKPLFSR